MLALPLLPLLPLLPPLLLPPLLLPLLLTAARAAPLYYPTEGKSLAAVVSEHARAAANEHVRAAGREHAWAMWPASLQEPRLPPALNLDTIKKVAEILIMLGEQVIPGITSEAPAGAGVTATIEEMPNDPVNIEKTNNIRI